MIHHYLYKTTNTKNGKIYVGVHSTDDLNDGYLGSGRILKRAIAKYGVESFTNVVLSFFDTRDLAYEAESLIVDAAFVARDDTYNITIGGLGGFHHINKNEDTKRENVKKWKETVASKPQEEIDRINKTKVNRGEKNGMFGVHRHGHTKGRVASEEAKEKIRQKALDRYQENPSLKETLGKYERTDKHLKAIEASNARTYVFEKDGEIVTIFNLAKFCRENGLSNACMTHVYAGRNPSHKGYRKHV